jgi:murein DD-endopeptidase MepM/ murein hydrolase activator NlpD
VYRAGTATEADYRALATVGSGTTNGAWRALAAAPPLPSGADVRALQVALNARLKEMKLTRIKADGDYGPITHAAAVYVAWRLGIGMRPATLRPLSVNRQRLIRHPEKRNATQLERAEERAKEPDGRVVRPLKTDPGPGSEFKLVVTHGAPGPDGKLYHAAKDWFAPGGSRVSAPVFGTVIEAEPSRTNTGKVYGGTVKIRALKDGKIWVFRHVDPKVGLNQPVIAGQPIARVTTWKDGPSHAHIEIWKTLIGGYRLVNMIDPMRYFR